MSRPDLSDPAVRAAYRTELRTVARWSRLAGYVLIFAALGLFVWPNSGGPLRIGPFATETWGWISLALGWAGWIGAIVERTRHHRRRMDEGA